MGENQTSMPASSSLCSTLCHPIAASSLCWYFWDSSDWENSGFKSRNTLEVWYAISYYFYPLSCGTLFLVVIWSVLSGCWVMLRLKLWNLRKHCIRRAAQREDGGLLDGPWNILTTISVHLLSIALLLFWRYSLSSLFLFFLRKRNVALIERTVLQA
jgi:hypothetical protein